MNESILRNLRVELVRKEMTQLDLARCLGHPVSTLSSWLHGVAPAPRDLTTRIEQALGLPHGTFALSAAPVETT